MPNSAETFAAKTAGKAAGLRARIQGLVGVFNVLAQQHKEAALLLSRLAATVDADGRRDLWLEVRRSLICHERAELSTVYPVIAENALNADITDRHAREAQELEAAISEIDAIGYESPRFHNSVQGLIQLLTRHVEEEEKEFFPRAQETMGKEAAHALERPFLAAQATCQEQLG
jgi:hemerythrin superfamily protein